MKFVQDFFKILRNNLGKIGLAILSALIFAVLLFPFNDLSDLFSTQVATLTHNQVFVQFDELKLSFSPTPGFGMSKVSVDTPFFRSLSAEELFITPSPAAFISQEPYGTIRAHGIFKGDLKASLSGGPKSANGVPRKTVEVEAKKLSLQDLHRVFELPIPLKGNLDVSTNGLVDLTLKEQPDLDLEMRIGQFELPPSNVPTPMGSLTLPELKLAEVHLKGRWSDGKFLINEGTLGKEGDELTGQIKGQLGLSLQGTNPIPGNYSLEISLNLKRSFYDRASIFFALLDRYKSTTPDGYRYAFRVSALNFQSPPTIGALQ